MARSNLAKGRAKSAPKARTTTTRRPKARVPARPAKPAKPKKSLPPQHPAAAPPPPVEPPAFDPALSALAAALAALLARFQEQDGASPHGAMTRALWALRMMLTAISRYLDNPTARRLVSTGAGLVTVPATTTPEATATATAPATTAPPPGPPSPALPSPSTALGAAHHRLAAIAREAFEDLAEAEASLGSADAAFHDPGATREAALGELQEGLRGLRRLGRTLGNLGHTLTGEPWQASPAAHLAALRELLAAAHPSTARARGSARLQAAREAFANNPPAPATGEASPAPSEGQAGLHPTHYALVLTMGEAFRLASEVSETATELSLDLRALDVRPGATGGASGEGLRLARDRVTELQGELFALVGQLGEASAQLTGEGAEACAADHVEALATLAALVAPDADAPWIRGPRIDGARRAFEGHAA